MPRAKATILLTWLESTVRWGRGEATKIELDGCFEEDRREVKVMLTLTQARRLRDQLTGQIESAEKEETP